jgi:uncharacterized protein YdbL (DUF1318 family)
METMKKPARTLSKLLLAAALGSMALSVPASAQRDPAYDAARSSGQIGEQIDGYLGFTGSPNPALRALVEDINIKRRAAYAEKAKAANATLKDYAFTSGCLLIARTKPGEMYQGPDGASWLKRGDGPPQRHPSCP